MDWPDKVAVHLRRAEVKMLEIITYICYDFVVSLYICGAFSDYGRSLICNNVKELPC